VPSEFGLSKSVSGRVDERESEKRLVSLGESSAAEVRESELNDTVGDLSREGRKGCRSWGGHGLGGGHCGEELTRRSAVTPRWSWGENGREQGRGRGLAGLRCG
jgi:hypothetical protein